MVLETLTGTISGWGGGIGSATILLINVALFGALIYMLYWIFSYNIKVNIYPADGIKIKDYAKYVKDKDNKKIQRFKLRKHTGWSGTLPKELLQASRGLFGRVTYEAYFSEDAEGNLHPQKYNRETKRWEGFNHNDMEWYAQGMKEVVAATRDDGFWMTYGQIIVPLVGFLIVGVVMIVMFNQMDSVAAAFNNAADKSLEAIRLAGSNYTQVIS